VTGLLFQGDNLPFLEAQPAGRTDLILTDPPFATGRRRSGSGPHATSSAASATRRPRAATPAPSAAPPSFEDRWPSVDAYLDFLRPRLGAMRELLARNGSLVVHLDYRFVHDVRHELDGIFGRDHFVNEIIWHYTGGGRARGRFSRKHDNLLWYAKGRAWTFHIDAVRQPYAPQSGYARGGIVSRAGKRYLPHPRGTPVDDVWDIPIVNPLSPERCGYPTQKPERLLERLILALSSPGDLVVDPFCGSGTTLVVAAREGRRWIGCDNSPDAIAATRKRLDAAGMRDAYEFKRGPRSTGC
jgi:site-specific DNA-methyltransferase (adenine-specific)